MGDVVPHPQRIWDWERGLSRGCLHIMWISHVLFSMSPAPLALFWVGFAVWSRNYTIPYSHMMFQKSTAFLFLDSETKQKGFSEFQMCNLHGLPKHCQSWTKPIHLYLEGSYMCEAWFCHWAVFFPKCCNLTWIAKNTLTSYFLDHECTDSTHLTLLFDAAILFFLPSEDKRTRALEVAIFLYKGNLFPLQYIFTAQSR